MRTLAAVGLAAALVGGSAAEAAAQSWRTVSMSRQKDGEPALDVRVTYGVGRFTIRPASQGLLYSMRLRYDEERFEPRSDFDGRTLRLGVSTVGRDINIGKGRSGELDLELATDVAMDLDLDFGAVEADLDLGGLSMTRLRVESGASDTRLDVSRPNPLAMDEADFDVGAAQFTALRLGNLNARRIDVSAGVGDVTLDLTGEWRRDGDVRVGMGLGSLRLRFPEGVGVRLRKESFLTALDSEGLIKRGDDYLSPDWESAERRITVEVDAAFGSIEVDWVR